MKAVLWDLDGTLISTKRLYAEAYSRALKPYIKRKLTIEDVRSVPVISELRFMRHLAGDQYDACVADFRRYYAELHDSHFDGVYEGVPATLDELRRRGLKLGIVTGKARASWEVSMTEANLGDFDVVVVDDDVNEPKPNPEGILLALSELAVDAREAVYIGDSLGDIVAAQQAGVPAAAALWSKQEPDRSGFIERLRVHGPAMLLAKPQDVLNLGKDR